MIICLGLLLASCDKNEVGSGNTTDATQPATESPQSEIVEYVDSVKLHIDAVNQQLKKSEGLEHSIKHKIETATSLKKQNSDLKNELTKTKDSIMSLRKELVEVKSKLPKKKNFLQKVFNIAPDSVEVIQIDTVDSQN